MPKRKKPDPFVHICSFTNVQDVKCGRYRFDFSEMFGPLFLDSRGEPLKRQPQPGSAAWKAFEGWHRQYRAAQRQAVHSTPDPTGKHG